MNRQQHAWKKRLARLLSSLDNNNLDAQISALSMKPESILGADCPDSGYGYVAEKFKALMRRGSEQGADALSRGILKVKGYPDYTIVSPSQFWSGLEDARRSWLWSVQQFDFLKDAAWALEAASFPNAINVAIELVDAWAEKYLGHTYSDEQLETLVWHDHATALRASNVILYIFLLRRTGNFTLRRQQYLIRLYILHLLLLSEESFYNRNNNHGFDQAIALYWLSAACSLGELGTSGRETGLWRIKNEIDFAFTEEGVHVENSPSYHISMVNRLLDLTRLFKAYPPVDANVNLDAILSGACSFLANIVKPDGTLPLIGDSRFLSLPKFPDLQEVASYGEWEYARTQGQSGTSPCNVDAIFPKSGWAFLRNGWFGSDTLYIAYKCGFLSTFHRHDDDNMFVLYAFGEDWLIDGGMYNYQEKDPLRRYLRSAEAHNIALIKGATPSRSLRTEERPCELTHWRINHDSAYVSSDSKMFPGFLYRRQLELNKRELSVCLTDKIEPENAKGHPNVFQLRFHLPLEKEVSQAESGVILVRSAKSRYSMRIMFDPEVFLQARILSGSMEPEIVGWVSPQFNTVEPAKTVVLESVARDTLDSVTRLKFLKE